VFDGAAAPSEASATGAEDDFDVDAGCKRFEATPWPMADLPTPAERQALAGCDSEALYYGIGRPANMVAARKCAYAELDTPSDHELGGAAILLMIYANGKGVHQDFDLSLRLACRGFFARAELEGRVTRLMDAKRQGRLETELDFCDDITSGYMQGFCAAHVERINASKRDARKTAATRGLPGAPLAELDKAAAAYFSSHSREEVDLTGTGRAALMIGEEARLNDDYVKMLAELATPAFTPPTADAAKVELEVNEVYSRLLRCMKGRDPAVVFVGSVSPEGIQRTERLWLPYREAWLSR
jgi:hypothetical protein